MNILAIDPGITGGYVFNNKDKLFVYKFTTMDEVELRILGNNIEKVYIEKVHSSPQMGVKSAFTFGDNFGAWNEFIRGSLVANKVLVPPQVWQKTYPHLQGIQGNPRKKMLKLLAEESHPDIKLTLATCDAILIHDYAQRIEDNKNG